MPFPSPVVPFVIEIHDVVVDACHEHPPGAVTPTVCDWAALVSIVLAGESANVHAAAAWVTLMVTPATVNDPLRGAVTVFAVTENVTAPLPLPLAPEVTVIHGSFDAAVHAHPAFVTTVRLWDAAPAARVNVVGATP